MGTDAMASNLPPGVTDAMIEDQAGIDPSAYTCQGNNCGDEASDVGPDGAPYCKKCLEKYFGGTDVDQD